MRKTFLLIICLFVWASCEKKSSPPPPPEPRTTRPIVLVSSPPYAYITKMVAGTTVDIECLIPPGTNPHLFEVSPKQAQKILRSTLWLRLGEPMEKKFLDIFRAHNKELEIVDLSENIDLLDLPHHTFSCHRDGQDRHFWMSPAIVKKQIVTIADSLSKLFPEYASTYRINLAESLEQLTKIDGETRALLSAMRPDAILISHPALGYFCREYGIEQLAIETEGKEPLPADLDILVKEMIKKKISSVLVLPQHNNQGALRIADLLHLSIHTIDPYAIDYPQAMRETALAITCSSLTN